MPGIYVQLLSVGGDVLADTFTDAEGAYLFDTIDGEPIPDGDYVVRFFPPEGWYLSPPDVAGAGADQDSDVPRTPSGTVSGLGPYHQTPVITLGDDLNVDLDDDGTPDGEADPTWDAGLWRAVPAVDIDKTTRDSAWPTNEAGDGVTILAGRPVTWTYLVTNTGNTRLEEVTVGDDGGDGPSFTVDDCTILDDGENADGLGSSADAPMSLNRGAVMRCVATGVAGGDDYVNEGAVLGTPVLDDGTTVTDVPPGYPALTPVTASDPSSYLSGAYDLALSKTPGVVDLATGLVDFTITVENQGTVDSGTYTVTDELPAGMSLDSATPAVTTESGSTLTWELAGLAPGTSRDLVIRVHIDDYLEGPFRNHAEISADGAASVRTGGVSTPTTDVDSTPETDPTNVDDVYYGPIGDSTEADNAGIDDAGVGADTEDDEDVADLVPGVVYDLALAKTADATALTQDDDATIEYRITVANQGNVPSGSYRVTDTLAPGLTPVTPIAGGGVVSGGSGDPVTVTWTGTNLAPGAQATFVLEVVVSDLDARPYRNVAEISADSAQALYGVDDVDSTPDTDPTNDNGGNGVVEGDGYGPVGSPASGGVDNLDVDDAGNGNDGEDDADIADVALPLVGGYDLALAKTVDAPTVAYDGTITYTVAVQNQGVLSSRSFEVTDHVPAGLVVVDDGGAVDGGDGTLTWTVDDLAPGATTTFAFTARVDDITQRPFRNHAEISADSADTYTVDGDVIADVDSTPDTDTGNDGTYGPVGAAGSVDNVGDDALLQAGVGADPEDDADIADVDVPVTYDLALVKTGPDVIGADGAATFVVTVANQGNVPSGPFTVVDSVPDGMAATDASTDGVISSAGDEVVWADLESLLPGDTVQLTVTTTITDVTRRPFTNVAEITEDGADAYSTATDTVTDVDSVPGDIETSDVDSLELGDAGAGADAGFDDEDIATLDAEVVYDLALTKTVDRATIAYDGSATFTVTVANQGNVASGATTVVDTVPLGLVADDASDGGVIADDGRSVTWVVELAVGEVRDLTLVVHVEDLTQRPYLNSAEITEDGADGYSLLGDPIADVDSVPGDDESSLVDTIGIDEAGVGDDTGYDDEDVAVLDVPVVYDLALAKRLLPDQRFAAGDVIRYEVEVSNEGNVPSGAFSVSDTLPEGMAGVAASHGGSLDGRMVVWRDLASLDPGASAVLTVDARLVDVTRDGYVNRAQVTDDGAGDYSTSDEVVTDRDSTPGDVRGEDDEGSAEIPLGQVAADNSQGGEPTNQGSPSGGSLPFTGGSFGGMLLLGLFALVAGGALVVGVRRVRGIT